MGKSKAEVAAQRIEERVAGVSVVPHFCRIEQKSLDFYEQFHIIVLGLDSLEARRYMNQVACSFLGRHNGFLARAVLGRCMYALSLPMHWAALWARSEAAGQP